MINKNQELTIGIDIGSANWRAVATTMNANSRYPIVLSCVKINSEGINKGNVSEVEEVSTLINSVVNNLEKEIGVRSNNVLISIGGSHLSSYHSSGHAQVSRGDATVTDLDIEKAIKDAEKGVKDIRNKKIIHTLPLKYRLDGQDVLGKILGLHGNKLEVKVLFITYPSQYMETLNTAIDQSKIRITDIVAGPIAESIPLLSKKQKSAGVALINIGASTTSILVYENNTPLLVSVIPIGGDDITKDIALGLKITLEEAEDVKCDKSTTHNSKKRIEEIVEARLEDVCEKINKELDRINRRELLPAGIVVIGDGSNIPNIDNLMRYFLKLPITLPKTEMSKLTNDIIRDSSFARSYGVVFLASSQSNKEIIRNLVGKFATSVKRFLFQFLP